MNVPNNKRRQNTLLKIHTAFIDLLETHELDEINVTDICGIAGINRTTFYMNFRDLQDLATAEMNRLEAENLAIFGNENLSRSNSGSVLLSLFMHIRENQPQYKTYFKLGRDGLFPIPEAAVAEASKYHNDTYGKYHQEFFRHGLSAIIKLWVNGGCKETPEEMLSILYAEYQENIIAKDA